MTWLTSSERLELRRNLARLVKFRIPQRVRYLCDAARASGATQLVLVSDLDAYCSEQQFAPFHRHRTELREQLKVVLNHRLLEDVLAQPEAALAGADMVLLKLSFRTAAADAERTVRAIAKARPRGAKLVYFDGDDDLAITWPTVLSMVDVYVKKHVFRDPAMYARRFVGKSNLTTYVAEKFGVSFADNPIPAAGPVPARDLARLELGYNLALDDKIHALYRRTQAAWRSEERPNDIVCRASMADWLVHLRKDIAPRLAGLKGRHRIILPTARVSQEEYDRELATSKLCISPFGFGEICWRDFEAVLWGCLMIKPDMSHVRTEPDLYVPYETYVPVKWDYSDLETQCLRFLGDEGARRRIVAGAYATLSSFYERQVFLDWLGALLERAGVRAAAARHTLGSAA
jgi:hypothetical protein